MEFELRPPQTINLLTLVFLLLGIFLSSGCAVMEPDYTIFLKEERNSIVNLKGETCLDTGYQIRKEKDGSYRLITFYENCDVQIRRFLREREKQQWILPDKPKKDGIYAK